MGVYKELDHEIQKLIKKQRKIYPDAADFGLPCNEQLLLDAVHKVLLEAKESFIVSRITTKYSTGQNVVYTFMIPWEQEDGWYRGTKYIFEYTGTNKTAMKDAINYFTITTAEHTTMTSPFKS